MTTDDSLPIPEPAIAPELPADDPDGHGADAELPAVRDLILTAYPDVVPDLVAGATIAELLASVHGARAAYAAVAERIPPSGARPAPVMIPGGGGAPLPVDPDRLPASEKIRRGLRAIPAAGGAR